MVLSASGVDLMEVGGAYNAGPGAVVFHAGTAYNEASAVVANGGRVLGVTALGTTIVEAQVRAYQAVDKIQWPEGFCRKDIGYRALAKTV